MPQIVQKLGRRSDARYQQMISCTRTCNVQQLSLSVVNVFQIRIIRDRFDPLLQWNYLVVTSHHRDGSKFQAFG